jgi:hypothetical protein
MIDPPTPVERRYRKGLPRKVPKGRVLVHNEVIAKRNTPQGEGAFNGGLCAPMKHSLMPS